VGLRGITNRTGEENQKWTRGKCLLTQHRDGKKKEVGIRPYAGERERRRRVVDKFSIAVRMQKAFEGRGQSERVGWGKKSKEGEWGGKIASLR